jgi:hypothetical protein
MSSRFSKRGSVVVLLGMWTGCSSSSKSSGRCGEPVAEVTGTGAATALLTDLELGGALAVGVGNDLIGEGTDAHAWALSPPPPIHYVYLVGLPDRDGWPDWNEDGTFIDRHAAAAAERCVVPAFTLYAMAVDGEGRPLTATNPVYMERWWRGYELALARLAAFSEPALLHVEPDFWGFMQQKTGVAPSEIPVVVNTLVPACADLDNSLAGFGRCLVRRARSVAPQVRLGFHASLWADPSARAVGAFLVEAGARDTDVLFVETLDRDAGCFEAGAAGCERDDGPWYWDATNATSPNFSEHLAAAKTLHSVTGLPLVWWQMPLGVASDTPGGVAGRYRDNRVAYFFDHPDEFAAAGAAAVLFGPGWEGQTDLSTDAGHFAERWSAYRDAPVSLP